MDREKYIEYIQKLHKMKPSEQIEELTGIKLLSYQKIWLNYLFVQPTNFEHLLRLRK